MLRNLTPEFYTALKQKQLRVALFIELEFALTVARFWTRLGTIEWQGVKWYGSVGPTQTNGSIIMGMSKTSESADLETTSVSFKLAGVPIVDGSGRNILELVTDYIANGGTSKVWLALFNLTTGELIADPGQYFSGIIDIPALEATPTSFTITLSAVSRLTILQSHGGQRYDNETQRRYFPFDLGLEFAGRSVHQTDDFGP